MSACMCVCYCVCLSVSLSSMCMLVRHDALSNDGAGVLAVMHGREDRSHDRTRYIKQVSCMHPLPKSLVSFAPYSNHLPKANLTPRGDVNFQHCADWVVAVGSSNQRDPPPHLFGIFFFWSTSSFSYSHTTRRPWLFMLVSYLRSASQGERELKPLMSYFAPSSRNLFALRLGS